MEKRIAVDTCIACGARGRAGECEDGCADVPVDLVDAGEVEALQAHLDALEDRVAGLRAVAETLLDERPRDWQAVRVQARLALRRPVPAAPRAQVVLAWGCPACGRVDAPQPCLGVCVRRPVLMAFAAEYREVEERVARTARADRALTALAGLVANVRPFPGQTDRTATALAGGARALLEDLPR